MRVPDAMYDLFHGFYKDAFDRFWSFRDALFLPDGGMIRGYFP